MSHDVNDLLQRTADEPTRPLDTAAVVGKAKRQTRFARAGAGLGTVAVVAVATLLALPMVTDSNPGLEIADQPDQTDQTDVLEERAPVAGSDASHWPVELTYRQYHRNYSLVFSGTSWSDWTLEAHGDDGGIRVFDRERDGRRMLDPDTGEMVEDSRGSFPRGAGPALHPEWRDSVGLIERVVVPLDQIPGGVDLVRSLGLDADDVEAYVTPNIIGCTDELDRCTSDENGVARAIAHRATGFPLFAEEGRGNEPTGVWLIAESFVYGDAVSASSTSDGPSPGTPGSFEWVDIVGPPAAIVSSTEPFHFAVAVSPGEDGRWCATTSRGSTFLGDATGRPCDQLLVPDLGDPRGFGSGASEVQGNPDGSPSEGMSWGLAPADADEVTVLLTDGTRVQAELADEATGDGRLWALGYRDTYVVTVEASANGTVLGPGIPPTTVPADGPVVTPQEAFGDRLEPAQLDRVGDEARAMFDLRADNELYSLQLPAGYALGIRVRDGYAPLMWATDCDLLSSEPLPDGWIGLCREYTHPEAGRVSGLFPHGTTSGTTRPTNP